MGFTPEQFESKKREIREGNDLLRTTFFPFLGKVVLTEGVANSPLRDDVITAIRAFYQFDGGNDPHHEHDFGAVEIETSEGESCGKRHKHYLKFFFKIDYYDQNFEFGADSYTEPFKRVLTIMRADEY